MRFTLFMLVWACLACTNSSTVNEESNVKQVQEMFEAFNHHDWKAMADHYTDTALFLDPSFGTRYTKQSRDEMIRKYTEMEQLFPNIHDSLVTILAMNDKVAVEFISTGTSGDSLSFRLPISCVLTLHQGLIIQDATYYNNCQE